MASHAVDSSRAKALRFHVAGRIWRMAVFRQRQAANDGHTSFIDTEASQAHLVSLTPEIMET
ncbi:MAG: hypothetical protein IPK39_09080 [Sulfuritalea sp.]|nr:hypothetical protein [Sulfuritalea sp.]